MRIAVIGAGALGGTFAALLSRAGHEVEVTARGAQLKAIRARGIRLSGGFGESTALVTASETVSARPELLLLCTKAQDAEAALRQNMGVPGGLDGVPVIVVQNGLDGVAMAERLLPASDCFGLLAIIAANYTTPGEVRITTAAPSYLGRGSGPADAATRHWQGMLSAAVPVIAQDNFVGAQWTKLIVNMLNGLPAITGLTVQQVVAHRGLRLAMTRSMREAVMVGIAKGVRFGALQGLGNARLRFFSQMPIALGQVLPLSMKWRMGNVPNLGSTQQSLRRGQPSEIDFLNGAIVREGAAAGIRTPVNAAITALVHEVEQSGEFLSPERALARIAAAA
ncbi:ketopantoate reductase family protein [Microterricola viridarii]|uniref:2-dehydropantoate 2-reductase n=1 Tax=Microterricola viridarii TaxID=412690 RepID=A0A0Y0MQS6_9MICO|nr:ketopantoate reductase family protein [Microterricola viridarii]AMB58103.1 2-dehydropantoate 2-reductase [Microterricola viridarii]